MSYFDPNTTVESKVRDTSIIPIKDGQFLMTSDTKCIFYDLGDKRIQLTDILEIDTEQERQGLLAPVNKFYFVKDTGSLWKYHNGVWREWPSAGAGSVVSRAIDLTLTAAGWTNGNQIISVEGLTAAQNGIVGMAQTISTAEHDAAAGAKLYLSEQAEGSFTIALAGDQPECDIPITLILFD